MAQSARKTVTQSRETRSPPQSDVRKCRLFAKYGVDRSTAEQKPHSPSRSEALTAHAQIEGDFIRPVTNM